MIPAVPDFGIGPTSEPGRVDVVAPGVRRLTAPNPGLMTGPGTNTYLVGDAEPVVVDPGPPIPPTPRPSWRRPSGSDRSARSS
jgi:hypothetical protein